MNCLAQPYGGTIFVESDIINASDSSALANVTYQGQGMKTVYDRRVNDWVTVNAYLFEVNWNDGLNSKAVVNPEFMSPELAQIEAEKYGRHIGKLPTCLRTDVNEIWIHKGTEPFGGGNRSILIHTGQSERYENDGILEETLVHEASHTSLDAMHAQSQGWINAQNLDGGFISDYAEEFPDREDVAESFLLWIAVRYRADKISEANFNIINLTIPNRLKYFDEIGCEMFPVSKENATAVDETSSTEGKHIIYPNPAKHFISPKLKDEGSYILKIYNPAGVIVLKDKVLSHQTIDISSLPKGMYIITLKNKEEYFKEILVIN